MEAGQPHHAGDQRLVALLRDGGPSFETFLKAHAGDPIMVDRVGRPSETILDPALALADLGLDESLAVAYRSLR